MRVFKTVKFKVFKNLFKYYSERSSMYNKRLKVSILQVITKDSPNYIC